MRCLSGSGRPGGVAAATASDCSPARLSCSGRSPSGECAAESAAASPIAAAVSATASALELGAAPGSWTQVLAQRDVHAVPRGVVAGAEARHPHAVDGSGGDINPRWTCGQLLGCSWLDGRHLILTRTLPDIVLPELKKRNLL